MKNTNLSRSGKQNGMYGTHRAGGLNPFFGKRHSEETKQKISDSKKGKFRGKESANWLGDRASYDAVHVWVRKYKGRANICEVCGITRNETMIHWANIDHKYRRNLDEYISLCSKCHWEYDKKNNNKHTGTNQRTERILKILNYT